MSSRTRIVAWLVLSGIPVGAARAEHAKISLDVTTSRGQVTAHVDQTPPATGKNPRPVIKARVNERVRVQWMFTNVYPHKTLENVVLHFYVAREEKAGQKSLPDLSDDEAADVETAIEMTFKPGSKAGQKSTIRLGRPGVYLVRIESRETQSDHEHFAAVDLVVEEESKTP
jgi:hypothetical protein